MIASIESGRTCDKANKAFAIKFANSKIAFLFDYISTYGLTLGVNH